MESENDTERLDIGARLKRQKLESEIIFSKLFPKYIVHNSNIYRPAIAANIEVSFRSYDICQPQQPYQARFGFLHSLELPNIPWNPTSRDVTSTARNKRI
jgi:hypothetical protein